VLLLLGVLTLIFWLLYTAVPHRRSRLKTRLLRELPGAVIAAVGWVGFSLLYSFYIDRIGNFSLYGSLTAVVLAMLWLYFCLYILFLGAEINVWLQQNALLPLLRRRRKIKSKKE
jgi:membrane protein